MNTSTERDDGNELEEARKALNDIDWRMGELFAERMNAVARVAAYKAEHNLRVFDGEREQEVIEANISHVTEDLQPYYVCFLEGVMELSKRYQSDLIESQRNETNTENGAAGA